MREKAGEAHVFVHAAALDLRLEPRTGATIADHHSPMLGPCSRKRAAPDRDLDAAIADECRKTARRVVGLPGSTLRRWAHRDQLIGSGGCQPASASPAGRVAPAAPGLLGHDSTRGGRRNTRRSTGQRASDCAPGNQAAEIVEQPVAAQRFRVGLGHVDDRRDTRASRDSEPATSGRARSRARGERPSRRRRPVPTRMEERGKLASAPPRNPAADYRIVRHRAALLAASWRLRASNVTSCPCDTSVRSFSTRTSQGSRRRRSSGSHRSPMTPR